MPFYITKAESAENKYNSTTKLEDLDSVNIKNNLTILRVGVNLGSIPYILLLAHTYANEIQGAAISATIREMQLALLYNVFGFRRIITRNKV